MKTIDFNPLKTIKDKTNEIFGLVISPRIPSDYDRHIFLRTELDTLFTVCNLVDSKAYKESFILLRAVFEKFLFFWLMFEGKKYQWITRYNIQPKISTTPREARDATISFWRKEKEIGNPKFENVLSMDPASVSMIIVKYESQGLYEKSDKDKTELLIPIYNFMLEQYKPSLAHIHVAEISEGVIPKSTLQEQIQEQKMIYNQFFYIDNIFRNLLINNLVDKEQIHRIRVHYSFLSEYVHASLSNLDIWRNINPFDTSPYHQYPENVLKELIFLYVAKLMELYLKVFISHYKKAATDQSGFNSYEAIVGNLDSLSEDLWFFESKPTTFDIQYANSINLYSHTEDRRVIYYKNPLERLKIMRELS